MINDDRLTILMKRFIYCSFCLLILICLSCNNKSKNNKQFDLKGIVNPYTEKIYDKLNSRDIPEACKYNTTVYVRNKNKIDTIEIAFLDSVCMKSHEILSQNVDTDTLTVNEKWFYLHIGKIVGNQQKYALLVNCNSRYEGIYTLTLYYYDSLKWKFVLQDPLIEINPMTFETFFDDYNFDGNNDICIHSFSGVGGDREYYTLWLYIPSKKSFDKCETFSGIPCPKLDKKNKKIKSHLNLGMAGTCYRNAVYFWSDNYLLLEKESYFNTSIDTPTVFIRSYAKNQDEWILNKQITKKLDKKTNYYDEYDLK